MFHNFCRQPRDLETCAGFTTTLSLYSTVHVNIPGYTVHTFKSPTPLPSIRAAQSPPACRRSSRAGCAAWPVPPSHHPRACSRRARADGTATTTGGRPRQTLRRPNRFPVGDAASFGVPQCCCYCLREPEKKRKKRKKKKKKSGLASRAANAENNNINTAKPPDATTVLSAHLPERCGRSGYDQTRDQTQTRIPPPRPPRPTSSLPRFPRCCPRYHHPPPQGRPLGSTL